MSDEGRMLAGRYRLSEKIGVGAMGLVWRAQDALLHRTVAVKQLMLTGGPGEDDEQARQRAMREGRIAARLQHPNAVTVYDVAEDGGKPWLVMEYVPAKSLAAVLAECGRLPPEQAARIGSQVAAALAAAHAVGVVHRDVKPSNVLLTSDGVVKITDFGISRAADDVVLTTTGLVSGTPAFLAPEVARGESPTPASDVFALGSTLYTTVEGRPPFGIGENMLATLHAVAGGHLVPARQAGPLGPTLMRLLAANPAHRPSMRDAREELAAVAAGQRLVQPMPAPMWTPPAVPEPPDLSELPALPEPSELSESDELTRSRRRPAHLATRKSLPAAQVLPVVPEMPVAMAIRAAVAPRRSTAKLVATVGVAIVLLAGVGVLVGRSLHNARPMATVAASMGTGQSGAPMPMDMPSTMPPPMSPSMSLTAPSDTATSPAPMGDQPTFNDMRTLITQYYALLPDQPDQAYQLLAPQYQQKTEGFAVYQAFYSTIASVDVGQITQTGPNMVNTVLTFNTTQGGTTHELYQFTVASVDGAFKIADATRLGAAEDE